MSFPDDEPFRACNLGVEEEGLTFAFSQDSSVQEYVQKRRARLNQVLQYRRSSGQLQTLRQDEINSTISQDLSEGHTVGRELLLSRLLRSETDIVLASNKLEHNKLYFIDPAYEYAPNQSANIFSQAFTTTIDVNILEKETAEQKRLRLPLLLQSMLERHEHKLQVIRESMRTHSTSRQQVIASKQPRAPTSNRERMSASRKLTRDPVLTSGMSWSRRGQKRQKLNAHPQNRTGQLITRRRCINDQNSSESSKIATAEVSFLKCYVSQAH